MPSQLHEALVELFRERPALAPDLLRGVYGIVLNADASVEVVAASFGDVRPPEYAADLVLHSRSANGCSAIILEVQLDADKADRDAKRGAWPRYVVWQWADTGFPTYLVVVTPSRKVERWAAEAIAMGHPGFALGPLVLGPSNVPALLDREQALASPELAVQSAVVHGRGKLAAQAGKLAVEAALAIAPDQRKLYVDMVLAALSTGARKQVEEIMIQNYEYQSEYARRYVQQGRAEGKAEDVLRVLEARGFAVPGEIAQRILACRDLDLLEKWLVRAATLTKLDQILA